MERPIILPMFAGALIAAMAALWACGDSGDREASLAAERTTAISRSAIDTSLAAAEEYFQADDLARAEAILLTLIDRAPHEAAALELHGQVLLARAAEARDRGDVETANEYARRAYERYRQVLEHSAVSAGLHHSAGDIASVAGLTDEALDHYLEAMRLDPAQPRHAIFAAQLLAESGRYDEAKRALRGALAIDPDEPYAHASLANVAMRRGQYDTALEHIREARSIRPADLSFRVIEAMIHRQAGSPHIGVSLLAGLPAAEQAQRMIASELAAGYAEIGDHAGAAAVWVRSFQARPQDSEAWRAAIAAAEQFIQADQPDEAIYWIEQARLAATVAGVAEHPEIRRIAARISGSK